MSERENIEELLGESSSMTNGVSRVSVAEEAVRRADALGDRRLQHDCRMELVEAAIFAGFPDKALVAFGWLSATCDDDPETFPASQTLAGMFLLRVDLLWCYKWIVQNTPGFPQISRDQIEDTLDEMERRYRSHGYSLRPVWMNRAWVGMDLGLGPDEVAEFFERWDRAPRDLYADCEACEQNFRVEVHRYRDDWDAAVTAAGPLLDGTLSCAEVPHVTLNTLTTAFWEHGDHERAAALHRRGYEMCNTNRDFLEGLAEHVDYRVLTGDLAGAVEIAERHLPWVRESRVGHRRWRWFVSMGDLVRHLAREREAVSIRLPEGLGPDEDGPFDPVELASWFDAAAEDLARAFDERNGNSFVSSRMKQLRERQAP